jgi:hypothetical protein
LLGDSAVAGQLHPTCSHNDLLSAHLQPKPQPVVQCALWMGVWRTWASSLGVNDDSELQNIEAILPRSQINQRDTWKSFKLSGLLSRQMVIGTSTMKLWFECWGCDGKIFKQSCQVQRINQKGKQMSWSSLNLSSVDGDWDVDHEQWLEWLGCDSKYSSNPAKSILEIDQWWNTIIPLDLLADLQSHGIGIKVLYEGITTK